MLDLEGLPLFQTREAALDALECAREGYVAAARKVALRLLETQPTVSTDQIRQLLPPPEGVDPRVMGAILRPPMFRKVGTTAGQACGRSSYHTRPVSVFALGAVENFPLTHDPLGGWPLDEKAPAT